MPFIEDTLPPVAAPVGRIPDYVPEESASWLQQFGAAMRTENTLLSAVTGYSPDSVHDPDFDRFHRINGTKYEAYARAFVDANTEDEVDKVMAQIDREEADREMLERAGGEGVLWMVAASILDPVNLIPVGGGAYKAYRGAKLVNSVAHAMKAGVVGTAAAETALHASQYTRTPLDTFENLAGSTVLSGMFGAAGHGIGRLLAKAGKTADEVGEGVKHEVSQGVRGIIRNHVEGRRIGKLVDAAEIEPDTIPLSKTVEIDLSELQEGLDAALVSPGRGKLKEGAPNIEDARGVLNPKTGKGDIELEFNSGVVKVVWSHGSKSMESPQWQVTRNDLTKMPTIFRRYQPYEEVSPKTGDKTWTWVVDRDAGHGAKRVLYVVKELTSAEDGAKHLVTVHLPRKKKAVEKYKPSLTRKEYAQKDASEREVSGYGLLHSRDTETGVSNSLQNGSQTETPTDNITPELENINPGDSTVGAARVDQTSLDDEGLKSAGGIEKLLKYTDPLQRMLSSSSRAARRAASMLAENPMTLKKNADGIATGVEGGAAETRTKGWQGDVYAFETELEAAFVEMRMGRVQKFGDMTKLRTADMMGRTPPGKMTYAEFKVAVAKAARRGDEDVDPRITRAAKAWRNLDDKIKQEAIRVGIWKDDVDISDTAVSHVTRIYNKEKIKAKRPEFVGIVARWLVRQADGPQNLDYREALDIAEQITDKVLGTPDGRLPYDMDMNEVARALKIKFRPGEDGLFKERTLKIRDTEIEDFLENDISVVARRAVASMAPDIELTRTFGDVAGTSAEKEIADDFNRLIAEAGTRRERDALRAAIDGDDTEAILKAQEDLLEALKRDEIMPTKEAQGLREALAKEKDAALRDFAAMRDRLRGTYKMPDDPDAWTVRAARAARQLNVVRLLGGMTISAFPDLARPVMVHGFGRVFGGAIMPMIKNMKAVNIARDELKLMGVGLDMINNSRAASIADVLDDYGRHSKLERGLGGLTNANGILTLMAPWNAALKQMSGVVTMTRILDACEAVARGDIKPKELERLAASGIDAQMAKNIAEQFAKHGDTIDGVKIANSTAWTADRTTISAFKSAVIRDVDRIIVTPGIGDRPLWMSSETGRLIGQFKSFGMSSVQRTLVSGLQDRDMNQMAGAALSIGLGMLAYATKAKLADRELSDDWEDWLGEGVDRSGLIGWLGDAYNIPAQAFGANTSRYASRSVVESLLGPTLGSTADLGVRAATDIGRGEFDQGTVHAVRRLMPYQNLFWFSGAMNQAEQGINSTFNIPKR